MPATAKTLLVVCAAAISVACSHTVTGDAVRAAPGLDDDSRSPVDVDHVLLEQSQMRAITGAGEDLTVIPSMDGKLPVDIDQMADAVPRRASGTSPRRRRSGPTSRSSTRRPIKTRPMAR